LTVLLELALGALWLSALYSLLSVAFALSFRVGGFFDLSIGSSFLIGAYGCWTVASRAPWIVAAAAGVFLAVLGAVSIGRWIVAPLAVRMPPLTLFVCTLAVLYVAQAVTALTFGEGAVVLRSGPAPTFRLGAAHATDVQLAFGSAAVVALMATTVWLRFFAWGRFARAVADDRRLASLFGIPVETTILLCYGISGALAGLAGSFFVADRSVEPSQGLTILLAAMVAAVLGGESVKAAIAGSVFLATLETSFGFLLPGNWTATVSFSLLLIVLVFRRGGLMQVARRQI
jgi:branched-subunit amino acid ABC-type transport system permease component